MLNPSSANEGANKRLFLVQQKCVISIVSVPKDRLREETHTRVEQR